MTDIMHQDHIKTNKDLKNMMLTGKELKAETRNNKDRQKEYLA